MFSHDRELNQTKALIEKLSATGKNFISKRDSLIEKKKVLEVEIEQLSESVHVSELSLAKMDESVSKLSEIVDDKQREVALAALELGQKHIDLTPVEPENKPCPFCGGNAEYNPAPLKVVCTKCGASADKDVWNNRV